jgi:hypothetical protein
MLKDSDSLSARNDFSQQLETLGLQFGAKESGASDVASWAREARNQAVSEGIGHVRSDDRDASTRNHS